MNTDKQIAAIYSTKEYHRFKFSEDNRKTNPTQVEKLINSMQTNGYAKGSILIINERNEIIDGQHRFLAAKEIGLPVTYAMFRGVSDIEIKILNQTTKNWDKIDFAEYWANKGNINYKALLDFMVEFPKIKLTAALMLLMNEPNAHPQTDVYQGGDFRVRSVEKARTFARGILLTETYYKDWTKIKFIAAMMKAMQHKDFKINTFIERLEKNRDLLYHCTKIELYLQRIEAVYNYHAKTNRINLI
jgi:hypothetical protein